MESQRLKLRVAPGTDEGLSRRVLEAVERVAGLQFVALDDGEVWDPILFLADAGRLQSGGAALPEAPRSFEARLVVALEGAAELPDEVYWDLRRQGAAEVIDLSPQRIDAELVRLRARIARWSTVDQVLTRSRVADVLVGRTPVWTRAMRALVEAALGGDQPVLICGETGTGKEAAARLVHELGRSSGGPYVVLDCASIVETLSGSELFGHRRGAFTGAERDREGAVQRANGGTLFLDELGELKPGLQAELLRVLQEGAWRPVGDDRVRQSKFRLVAATNRDLLEMVRAGTFRRDLYQRIAAVTVTLPPLRDRRDDIALLAGHFLRELLPEYGPLRLDDRLQRLLQGLPLEGNVRQLRSIIQVVASHHDGSGVVGPGHLPAGLLPTPRRATPDGWDASELQRTVEQAVRCGATFKAIVDACKEAACAAALRMSGSARLAARMLAVSTRMVEKRRRPEAGDARLKIAS